MAYNFTQLVHDQNSRKQIGKYLRYTEIGKYTRAVSESFIS